MFDVQNVLHSLLFHSLRMFMVLGKPQPVVSFSHDCGAVVTQLDAKRTPDETMVVEDDPEVKVDEEEDEWASFFTDEAGGALPAVVNNQRPPHSGRPEVLR